MTEIFNSISSAVTEVTGGILDSALDTVLYGAVYPLFYYIGVGLTWILQLLYSMFEVFSGQVKVVYNGAQDYLTNIFFSTSVVNNLYWGMALIGIAMCFGFAIVSVARKTFDVDQKQQRSMGQILRGTFKSTLIIVSLSAVMTVTLNATSVLLQQIEYMFSNASTLHLQDTIEFDDEQYAAMGRVLSTIGNYSANPSYKSRYNINSCYNEVRSDLDYLSRQGVFTFYYATATDADGQPLVSWQSALQKLVNAGDPSQDLKMDMYYDEITKAMTEIMDEMRNNASFAPLKSFDRQYAPQDKVPLDRLVFLMSTLRAAKNPTYNEDSSLTDPVRGPYFAGYKNIYDLDSVKADFDISPSKLDYLVLYLGTCLLILDMAGIILVCAARIFNLILLYIAAPPFIATMPMDDGGKFKQWTTAYIVQCFGMFGTIISMRIFMIFLPIVTSSDLVLFDNILLNNLAKLVLILGAGEAVKRANGMITGILADNAGFAAINAGDLSGAGRGVASKIGVGLLGGGLTAGGNLIKGGAKLGWGGAKLVGQSAYGIGSFIASRIGSGSSGGSGSGGGGAGDSALPTGQDRSTLSQDSAQSGGSGGGGFKYSDLPPQEKARIHQNLFGVPPKGSIPKPPPRPVRNDAGKYVPEPPPMPGGSSIPKPPPRPVSNGAGRYVPEPPPMPGGSSIPKPPPRPVRNAAGKYVPEPPPMQGDGSLPDKANPPK